MDLMTQTVNKTKSPETMTRSRERLLIVDLDSRPPPGCSLTWLGVMKGIFFAKEKHTVTIQLSSLSWSSKPVFVAEACQWIPS